MKSIILLFLITLSFTSQSEIRSVHCPLGCPSLTIEQNDVVFNFTYALSNNPTTKFADWVAYEVNVLNFGDSPGRDWGNDPLVDDDESLEEDDFKGAFKALKTDRGHLAPLASFAGNTNWSELNYLSNITPQKSALNQGAWVDLENAVREAVSFRDSLYVITGTLYLESETPLPGANEPHKIPSAFYKVIYDLQGNSASFIFDQDLPKSAQYCDQITSNMQVNKMLKYSMPKFKDSKELTQRIGC
ncbi:DNA/RNA non-specific endonuclease [Pseudoalteromonas sp.]|uniref:DNA/RNA non-specific endonuclease n=1 Tax=Pseudoalteromonas sp. TaxID=53249 RepID=UPI00261EC30E|nr:DNA/RNA non-specific endonuclease [Pseudoalteromonas sp.]MCP4587020.1 DNA/RNA non-specific endonuclease [Pseudoalteromonas sp.]